MHCPAVFHERFRHPPVRGLIFDLDGTIVDTRAWHMAAWRALVTRLNLTEREYQAAERGFGQTNWAIFRQWFGRDAGGRDLNALSDEKEALYRQLIHGRAHARPGFMELVSAARRRGIKIGLATSGPRENALALLDELGVARLFDAVVWGDPSIRSKPHPDSFLRAASRMGLPPQQCVGLEDSTHGFWAVLRAGMRLVAIVEQPPDWVRHRKWTPFVFEDFRPVVRLLKDALIHA